MKKIHSIFITLTLLVSFFACTDNTNQTTASTETTITKVYPANLVTNQKFYIVGQNLDSVTEVILPGGDTVTNFERQGFNQLSLTATPNMKSGYIILRVGATEYKAPNQVNMVIPSFTRSFPDTVKATELITILGVNLLEIQQVIIGGNTIIDALHFTRKSDTEIKVKVPVSATTGKASLKMVTLSGTVINFPNTVYIVPPGVPALKYAFYEDALMNGWQNWGWGSTVDYASAEQFRVGKLSMKVTFSGAWGAAKFTNGSLVTTPYVEFAFSVFGGPGTDGKTINVIPNGGKNVSTVIKAGVWTDISIPLSDLGSVSPITYVQMQETGWSGIVYLDHVGFR
jgi:hypothetical protein